MSEKIYYGFYEGSSTLSIPCNNDNPGIKVGSHACQICDNFKENDADNQFVICEYEEINNE
jgi:hypothetical protein